MHSIQCKNNNDDNNNNDNTKNQNNNNSFVLLCLILLFWGGVSFGFSREKCQQMYVSFISLLEGEATETFERFYLAF